MTGFDYSLDPLLTANIENSVRRGSAEILEETETGIFIYDRQGEVYVLYAPTETGKLWLRKHEERDYHLIVLYDDALIAFAVEQFGFGAGEKCKQVVWTAKEPPCCTNMLRTRTATEDDIPLCMSIYRNSSEEDVREAVLAGDVVLGYEGEELAGMIGLHTEGSMGMLEVLPAFRRKGYGTELEKALIARQLSAGLIPYGQVYLSNAASFALQESIGMACSEGTMTWMWRE